MCRKLVQLPLLFILAISCKLSLGEVKTFEAEISPANYYTLVAPYAGTVLMVQRPGSRVEPEPESWPADALDPPDQRDVNLWRRFVNDAGGFAVAQLVRDTKADEEGLIIAREEATSELSKYGVKTYDGNFPPWEFNVFWTDKQRYVMAAFYEEYARFPNMSSGPPFSYARAKEELSAYRSSGKFDTVLASLVAQIRKGLSPDVTDLELREAVLQVLIWYAKGDLLTEYGIFRDPFTGDVFEPNSNALLSAEGKIEISTPRDSRQSSEVTPRNTSLLKLGSYWEAVASNGDFDSNDVNFLNGILRAKKTLPTEAARRAIAAQIVRESKEAGVEIQKGGMRGTLVNLTSLETPTSDRAQIEATLRRVAKSKLPTFQVDDATFKELARALSLALPPPSGPTGPPFLAKPQPSAASVARIANELRSPATYKGEIVNAYERPGLIYFITGELNRPIHLDGFNFNLRLWGLTVPLGGNGDNGTFFETVNIEAVQPQRQRFDDIEELREIEVRTAIALSPAFVSITRVNDSDTIASALREFEYQKVEAGRAIRRTAESIRRTNRQLSLALRAQRRLERSGFFFAPEPSLVVSNRVQKGTHVASGAPIAVVRPLLRHHVKFQVQEEDLPFLRIGEKIAVNVRCSTMQAADSMNATSPKTSLPPITKPARGDALVMAFENRQFEMEVFDVAFLNNGSNRMAQVAAYLARKPPNKAALRSESTTPASSVVGRRLQSGLEQPGASAQAYLPAYARCMLSI